MVIARSQAGHDLWTGRGTVLGEVFIEVNVADPVQVVFDAQWPRMMAASLPGLAWVMLSEVTA